MERPKFTKNRVHSGMKKKPIFSQNISLILSVLSSNQQKYCTYPYNPKIAGLNLPHTYMQAATKGSKKAIPK